MQFFNVLTYYDFAANAIVVEPQEGSPGEKRQVSYVLLEDATAVIKEGERYGCGETGYLGFVKGREVREESLAASIGNVVMEGEPISWNGYAFITRKGKKVATAKRIAVIDKMLVGVGVQTVE